MATCDRRRHVLRPRGRLPAAARRRRAGSRGAPGRQNIATALRIILAHRAGRAADAAGVRRRAAALPLRAEHPGHAPADRGRGPPRGRRAGSRGSPLDAIAVAGRPATTRRPRGRPCATGSSPPAGQRARVAVAVGAGAAEGAASMTIEPPVDRRPRLRRAPRRGEGAHPGPQPGVDATTTTADPGITLLQLLAFMTESLLYRANLIPERNRRAFLRLLGLRRRPAVPGRGHGRLRRHEGPARRRTSCRRTPRCARAACRSAPTARSTCCRSARSRAPSCRRPPSSTPAEPGGVPVDVRGPRPRRRRRPALRHPPARACRPAARATARCGSPRPSTARCGSRCSRRSRPWSTPCAT